MTRYERLKGEVQSTYPIGVRVLVVVWAVVNRYEVLRLDCTRISTTDFVEKEDQISRDHTETA